MKNSRTVPSMDGQHIEGRKPSEDNGRGHPRILWHHHTAIAMLFEARQYAHTLGRDAWDFAVEINELRKTGLSNSDLRHLACECLVIHAVEISSANGQTRAFQPVGHLELRERSCFVLTETGARLAADLIGRQSCQAPLPVEARLPVKQEPEAEDKPVKATIPKWDRDRAELRLGDTIVKKYQVPAANQELVLAAMEEEKWPVRIDDPLPPESGQDPKRRLHTTINALNRNQRDRLICFRGDGHGEGIRWELIEPSSNGNGDTREGVD